MPATFAGQLDEAPRIVRDQRHRPQEVLHHGICSLDQGAEDFSDAVRAKSIGCGLDVLRMARRCHRPVDGRGGSWDGPTPPRGPGSRKNGEATPRGWIAEQTSWANPGRVSFGPRPTTDLVGLLHHQDPSPAL